MEPAHSAQRIHLSTGGHRRSLVTAAKMSQPLTTWRRRLNRPHLLRFVHDDRQHFERGESFGGLDISAALNLGKSTGD